MEDEMERAGDGKRPSRDFPINGATTKGQGLESNTIVLISATFRLKCITFIRKQEIFRYFLFLCLFTNAL